jgi:hypothetical protein
MNHVNAWELIPWIANGSASGDERAELQLHLEECAECRTELAAQRALMQAMRTSPLVEKMPHASFNKLRARIDEKSATPTAAASQRPRRTRLVQWLTAAVVLHAILLGALVLAVMQGRQSADTDSFRTVSSAEAGARGPGIRAVFSADLTMGDLLHLLEDVDLQITAGPSAEGVYTLAPAGSSDGRAALTTLRAHPGVRFAEPLGP